MKHNVWIIYKTRFPELGYCKVGKGLWRFVCLEDIEPGRLLPHVGPYYASKAELLADMERYHRDSWEST